MLSFSSAGPFEGIFNEPRAFVRGINNRRRLPVFLLELVGKRRRSALQVCPKLPRAGSGLRVSVGAAEEKSHDFFEHFLSGVDGPVNAVAGLGPVDITRRHLARKHFIAVAELNTK